MTEKQLSMFSVIESHFSEEAFEFQDLKAYGDFYPATLTSLVKQGLVEKLNQSGKGLYQMRVLGLSDQEEQDRAEEFELERNINRAKGVLDHLVNSKASWVRQMAELGLEFPEEEFENWSKMVYERTSHYLSTLQDKLKSIQSAF